MSQTKNNNEYLALREAKIKRNNERLEELGLVKNSNSNNHTSNDNGGVISTATTTMNDTRIKNHINDKKLSSMTLRRSLRTRSSVLSSDENSNDVVQKSNVDNNKKTTRKRKFESPSNSINSNQSNRHETTPIIINNRPQNQSIVKPGTTRATQIDISKVLHGDFNYPLYIGQQLAITGKAAVVNHAMLVCRNFDTGISFNKYSGVCEWKNDAVFLWVNIGSPDAEVTNEFYIPPGDDDNAENNNNNNNNKYMHMTWYGGSKMKADSTTIQTLLYIGQKASRSELPSNDGIILWCRLYNKKTKSFDPYTCLGRLSYVNHDPKAQPLKFVWNLLDYHVLLGNSKLIHTTNNVFQQIIHASSNHS